jgi:hypothetical protein
MDIIDCLGDRPFPLPDSIKDYLDEIKKRRDKQDKGENVEVTNNEEEGVNEKEKEVENNEEKKVEEVQVNEKSKMNNN